MCSLSCMGHNKHRGANQPALEALGRRTSTKNCRSAISEWYTVWGRGRACLTLFRAPADEGYGKPYPYNPAAWDGEGVPREGPLFLSAVSEKA